MTDKRQCTMASSLALRSMITQRPLKQICFRGTWITKSLTNRRKMLNSKVVHVNT